MSLHTQKSVSQSHSARRTQLLTPLIAIALYIIGVTSAVAGPPTPPPKPGEIAQAGQGTPDVPTVREEPKAPNAPRIDSVEIDSTLVDVIDSAELESLPVFRTTELKDGVLRAIDLDGREWRYDFAERRLTMDWQDPESSDLIGSTTLFTDGEDTILVGDDRDEEWASELLRLPRYSSDQIRVQFEQHVRRTIRTSERVRVDGLVSGNVYAQDKVIVSATGVIDGDVYAPEIDVRTGGMITGREEIESSLIGLGEDFDRNVRDLVDLSPIVVFGAIVALVALVAFITFSVSPTAVERASDTISRHPWMTFWVGLAGAPIYLLAATIILFTFVGIPLSILMIIALPWALLVGIVAFSRHTGNIVLRAYGITGWSPLKQVVLGSAVLMGTWAIAIALVGSRADFLAGWGSFFLVVAILATVVTLSSGFGALALTRFGRREFRPAGAQSTQTAQGQMWGSSASSAAPPPPSPPPLPVDPPAPEPPPLPPSQPEDSGKKPPPASPLTGPSNEPK